MTWPPQISSSAAPISIAAQLANEALGPLYERRISIDMCEARDGDNAHGAAGVPAGDEGLTGADKCSRLVGHQMGERRRVRGLPRLGFELQELQEDQCLRIGGIRRVDGRLLPKGWSALMGCPVVRGAGHSTSGPNWAVPLMPERISVVGDWMAPITLTVLLTGSTAAAIVPTLASIRRPASSSIRNAKGAPGCNSASMLAGAISSISNRLSSSSVI